MKVITSLLPEKEGVMPAIIVNVNKGFIVSPNSAETYKIFFTDDAIFNVLTLSATGEWECKFRSTYRPKSENHEVINSIALSNAILTISDNSNSNVDINLFLTSAIWKNFIDNTRLKLLSFSEEYNRTPKRVYAGDEDE